MNKTNSETTSGNIMKIKESHYAHSLVEAVSEGVVVERTLQNVALIKAKSLNGRIYTEKALKSFAKLAVNARVYFDHYIWDDANRSVRDLAGWIISAKYSNGEVRGDVSILTGTEGDKILEVAKVNPTLLGFSGVSRVETNEDETEVLDIKEVISVDLVTNPATTPGGFFESKKMEETLTLEELKTKVKELEAQNLQLTEENKDLATKLEAVTKRERVNAEIKKMEIPDERITPKIMEMFMKIQESELSETISEFAKAVAPVAPSSKSGLVEEATKNVSSETSIKEDLASLDCRK